MGSSHILVVDDNPGDIRFIEEALEVSKSAPTVHATNTKDEALNFIYRRNGCEDAPKLDAVLLDWHLSRSTSREVLDALESTDPELPVIVMTGSESELDKVRSLAPQAETWEEKPTEPGRYVDILRPYIPVDP